MEDKFALVQFVLLHGDGTNRIYSKKLSNWEEAAKFLKNMCGSVKTSKKLHFVCMIYVFLSNQSINQSCLGGACRSMVTSRLSSQFSTAEVAETTLKDEITERKKDEQLDQDICNSHESQILAPVPAGALPRADHLSSDESSPAQAISKPDVRPISVWRRSSGKVSTD